MTRKIVVAVRDNVPVYYPRVYYRLFTYLPRKTRGS